jgi:hypothetical protein
MAVSRVPRSTPRLSSSTVTTRLRRVPTAKTEPSPGSPRQREAARPRKGPARQPSSERVCRPRRPTGGESRPRGRGAVALGVRDQEDRGDEGGRDHAGEGEEHGHRVEPRGDRVSGVVAGGMRPDATPPIVAGEEERRQDRRHAEHPAELRGSALAVIQWFAFSRYEVTLTMPARPCTIQRAPRMISSVSGENRSSGSPRADFLAHRSPYPLMLMSWASGARQPAYPAGRLSPAVGPHDPGW